MRDLCQGHGCRLMSLTITGHSRTITRCKRATWGPTVTDEHGSRQWPAGPPGAVVNAVGAAAEGGEGVAQYLKNTGNSLSGGSPGEHPPQGSTRVSTSLGELLRCVWGVTGRDGSWVFLSCVKKSFSRW